MLHTVTGYENVSVRSEKISLRRGEVKYALLPVWLLTTKWQGKNYLFAMNGQTGKMVGDLPADKTKLRLWFWGVTAAVTAACCMLFMGPLGRWISGLLA